MKATRILSAIVSAVCILCVSAAAADFVPSVEAKNAPEVVYMVDASGNPAAGRITAADGTVSYMDTAAITITAKTDTEADAAVLKTIGTAMEELTEKALPELIADFAAVWADVTEGAPVENAVVATVFDISSDVEIPEGGELTITLSPKDIAAEDFIVVLHKVRDTWKVEPHTRDGKGNIIITVSSLSPFAIVKDSAAAPVKGSDAPRSPQTEEIRTAPAVAMTAGSIPGAAFWVRA